MPLQIFNIRDIRIEEGDSKVCTDKVKAPKLRIPWGLFNYVEESRSLAKKLAAGLVVNVTGQLMCWAYKNFASELLCSP